MRERAARSLALCLRRRVGRETAEAGDSVLQNRRQRALEVLGRGCREQKLLSIDDENADGWMIHVCAAELPKDSLDFALLGDCHGELQTQSQHRAVEVLGTHDAA